MEAGEAWPCICAGLNPDCSNCGGTGRIVPRDWCAACAHRLGHGCRQIALGLSAGIRERGGAWVSVCLGEQRLHRCPRYAGPETDTVYQEALDHA